MKKLIITTLAILLIAIGGYAQDVATVYINRPFQYAGSGMKHDIEINNVHIGAINSGESMAITVPVGSIIIKDYYGNSSFQKRKENEKYIMVGLNIEAGQNYFVKINEATGKMIIKDGSPEDFKKASKLDFATLQNFSSPVQPTQVPPTVSQQQTVVQTNSQQVPPTVSQQQTIVQTNSQQKPQIVSDVDKNIPVAKSTADNIYVLIIANEEYQFVDNVNFAMHDGETFKEYCIKALGIPERQIRFCPNASYGIISGGVDWLKYALDNFEGSKGIVYYCGHGIPDEKSGEAFIVPVDGKGTNTTTCYSLNTLYKTLAETKAANVTYFMDACFTGANKEGSMLVAARGVAREPAKATVGGNSVVFSASSSDETAMTYPEKGHGLFTYFLLKKLQETGGDVSYSELSKYINSNVKKEAFLINEKPQTPVVATSPEAQENWKEMKLK